MFGFCRHDWVRFRIPKYNYMSGGYLTRPGYWFHHNCNLLQPTTRGDNYPPDSICDLVCSKCNKLRLNIDRVTEKLKAERDAKKTQQKMEEENQTIIKERRDSARAFATKYIGLMKKSKK